MSLPACRRSAIVRSKRPVPVLGEVLTFVEQEQGQIDLTVRKPDGMLTKVALLPDRFTDNHKKVKSSVINEEWPPDRLLIYSVVL